MNIESGEATHARGSTKSQVMPIPIVKSEVCSRNYCFGPGPFTTRHSHYLRASEYCFCILSAMHSFSLPHAQWPTLSPKSSQCKSAPRYCEVPWVWVVSWLLRMANTPVSVHEPPWAIVHQLARIIQRFAFPKSVSWGLHLSFPGTVLSFSTPGRAAQLVRGECPAHSACSR